MDLLLSLQSLPGEFGELRKELSKHRQETHGDSERIIGDLRKEVRKLDILPGVMSEMHKDVRKVDCLQDELTALRKEFRRIDRLDFDGLRQEFSIKQQDTPRTFVGRSYDRSALRQRAEKRHGTKEMRNENQALPVQGSPNTTILEELQSELRALDRKHDTDKADTLRAITEIGVAAYAKMLSVIENLKVELNREPIVPQEVHAVLAQPTAVLPQTVQTQPYVMQRVASSPVVGTGSTVLCIARAKFT